MSISQVRENDAQTKERKRIFDTAQALYLKHDLGFSNADIAKEMGIDESTVLLFLKDNK